MVFFQVLDQLRRTNVYAEIFARRLDRFKYHVLYFGLLEIKFVLFYSDIWSFSLFLNHVYRDLVLWLIDTLWIDGPPTTDQPLIVLIYADLWYLVRLARWITLQKIQDLVIFLTFLLLEIMVSDFDDVKSKVLIINFFFLVFYMWIEILLLVNIQILILISLRHQVVGLDLLLILRNKSLIGLNEVFNEPLAGKSCVFVS